MSKITTWITALACALVFSIGAALAGEKLKVVYHVSEIEKVPFTLGNIKNHIKGVGGKDNVEIILVAHGPALKAFHDMAADEKISKRVTDLQGMGVNFEACGNTMRRLVCNRDRFIASAASDCVRGTLSSPPRMMSAV